MNHLNTTFQIVITLIIILSSCNPSKTPSEADRAAVEQLITVDFKAAWDINDEAAIAAMFLEDADLSLPQGTWIRGRGNIQKAFTRDHPDGLTGTFSINDLRFIDNSIALVNIDAHFSGGKDRDGNPVPDNWDAGTAILKKADGSWKYAALRVLLARLNLAEERAKIRESWDHFSENFEKGDIEGMLNCFTKDAINMLHGMENNVGREEIGSMFEGFLAERTVSNAKSTTIELDIMGPKAYEYGIYEDTITPKNGKSYNRKVRYMAVWRKESDGIWRGSRFILNDAPV